MRIVICDDDKDVLKSISKLIKNRVNDEIVSISNYLDLIDNIKSKNIDILFLDIRLDDKNGIEIVKEYNNYLINTQIVYITGYDDYNEMIFETNPIYLLKKPVDEEKINKALDKAISNYNNLNKKISIKSSKEIFIINTNDIIYIESFARVIKFHLINDKIITTYSKIGKVFELLPNKFIKIHQSYVINIDKVTKYKNNEIELENKVVLPISRKNQLDVKNRIIRECDINAN